MLRYQPGLPLTRSITGHRYRSRFFLHLAPFSSILFRNSDALIISRNSAHLIQRFFCATAASRSSFLFLMILAFAGRTPGAVPRAPVRELRAVWITTVNGLDWPGTYDPVQQRKSLAEILDKLAAAHFNTVFFQVRCRADAV